MRGVTSSVLGVVLVCLCAPSTLAADAHASTVEVDFVSNPGATWVVAVAAIPRGEVPRGALTTLAAWVTSSHGETDGTWQSLRKRGGTVDATATADGLIVTAQGAPDDASLVVNAVTSFLAQTSLSIDAISFEQIKRQLFFDRGLHASGTPGRAKAGRAKPGSAKVSEQAWAAFFRRMPPKYRQPSTSIANMIPLEVVAAHRLLKKKRALVVVESDPLLWGTPPNVALNIKRTNEPEPPNLSRLLAIMGAKLLTSPRVVTSSKEVASPKVEQKRTEIPRPSTQERIVAGATFVLVQPLSPEIAHHTIARALLVRELSVVVAGNPGASDVWVESTRDAALLFVSARAPATPASIREKLTSWQQRLRYSIEKTRNAAALADREIRASFRVGDRAQRRARAYLAGDATGESTAMTTSEVRELVEELALQVFPHQMRVFALDYSGSLNP